MIRRPPRSTLFPYTDALPISWRGWKTCCARAYQAWKCCRCRSEEHTSELQSRLHLVCRLLLEKKKNPNSHYAGTQLKHPTTTDCSHTAALQNRLVTTRRLTEQ